MGFFRCAVLKWFLFDPAAFFFFCLFFTCKKECTLFRLMSVWFCKSIGLCWISCVDLLFYCWKLIESDVHHKPEIQEFKSSELERWVPAQNEVFLPCYHFSRSCKAGKLVFPRDKMLLTSMSRQHPFLWARSQLHQPGAGYAVWPSVALQLPLVPTEPKVLAVELWSRFPDRVELLLSSSN